jgi:hypothetical protein
MIVIISSKKSKASAAGKAAMKATLRMDEKQLSVWRRP